MSREHIYKPQEIGARISDSITAFFGTWISLGLHTIWFVLWFMFAWDVALLTNIVSLEAIFLAILILMSQARTSKRDELRDDLEAEEVEQITRDSAILKSVNQEQLSILREQEQLGIKLDEILAVLHKMPAPLPPKGATRPNLRSIKKAE